MIDIKDKLIKLSEEVADYLGIDLIPIEYENLEVDDSRLILEPIPKIVLNIKYENNFIESAKCITHEMRHIFQIYWANLMNDKLARIWKEELAQTKSSANIDVNSNEYRLSKVFWDFGKDVRKKLKLDVFDNDEMKYTIIFPDNLELLLNSFFLGLFGKSYLSLGLQKFNEKYLFSLDNLEYKESIQIDIDDGISYITTNINSID